MDSLERFRPSLHLPPLESPARLEHPLPAMRGLPGRAPESQRRRGETLLREVAVSLDAARRDAGSTSMSRLAAALESLPVLLAGLRALLRERGIEIDSPPDALPPDAAAGLGFSVQAIDDLCRWRRSPWDLDEERVEYWCDHMLEAARIGALEAARVVDADGGSRSRR